MSAKINSIIPDQQYEAIRERIGAILFVEFDNQEQLTYNPDLLLDVWVERNVPFDKEEVPCINVSLANGEYDNKDFKQVDGTYTYFIDYYAKAKSAGGIKGDVLANIKLQKLVGIGRAILENPVYKRLDFPAPSISRVMVTSIQINNEEISDKEHIMMARMVFTVRVVETTPLGEGLPFSGFDTSVKMSLTDQGYVFTGNAVPDPVPACEPAIININDEYFTSVPSGSTRNIPILYENGDPVPAIFEYGEVIIPDPGGVAEWEELWP